MTQAQLARKLARMADRVGAQRPPVALNRGMLIEDRTPRDLLAEEQDRRRENLAEELLKIFAEEITWESAEDDATEQANATRAATCAAHAALAAATVLYPEVPEPAVEPDVPADLPVAAI